MHAAYEAGAGHPITHSYTTAPDATFSEWSPCTAASNRGPNIRKIYIECYAEGRPAPRNVSQLFAEFLNTDDRRIPDWRFSPGALPVSHKAHRNIFPVRICAQRTPQDGETAATEDEDYQDLKAILRDQVSGFFLNHNKKPLLLRLSTTDEDDTTATRYSGVELAKGFLGTRKEDDMIRSKFGWGEPICEVLFTVGAIGVAAYIVYVGIKKFNGKSAATDPSISSQESPPPIEPGQNKDEENIAKGSNNQAETTSGSVGNSRPYHLPLELPS
ncbi:hypothetical protein PT974_12465 [Cladobotryum mycophilum]|uniref:Uncharacterized protein n=1 Tax=Cladobotryum mycophilum TaxID=491253 RepID=A0ABR0S832_9HYPO